MAIATLAKLANNGDVFTGVVKIRKGQALRLLMDAGAMSNVYSLFLNHCRQIAAAIPRHHKAAHALAHAAAAEVEAICLGALPNGAAALAASPLLSPAAVLSVGGVLLALLRYLYTRSQSGGWGDGAVAYLPRITDSWDVAALAGVVACIAVLFGGAGVPVALHLSAAANGGAGGAEVTPPGSPKGAGAAAAAAVAGSGSASAGEAAAAAATAAAAASGLDGPSAAARSAAFAASAKYLTAANAAAGLPLGVGGDDGGEGGGAGSGGGSRRRASTRGRRA
jgi:hypothetical protein